MDDDDLQQNKALYLPSITFAGDFSNRSIQFEYEFEVNGRKYTANTKTTETP